jgi:hypothetical protein
MRILAFNWNNVLTDVIEELKNRGHEILPLDGKKETLNKADVVVVWNETELGGWRDMIKDLKKKKKRVILVQHGRKGSSRIYPPFNETLLSDYVCVWGEKDKERLMSVGTPEERIKVCGTPIFKHLKPRVKHKGYNVVFSPEHWDIDVAENWLVARELRKLKRIGFKKVNIITKGLIGHQIESMYDNLVVSDRNSPEHWEVVADVLSKADLVVSISESTFELLAQSLDIPVVIADVWEPKACDGDERYKDYHREYSNAVAMAKLPDLIKTIKLHMKHPELLSREKVVIEDGGINIENPIDEICKVILNK